MLIKKTISAKSVFVLFVAALVAVFLVGCKPSESAVKKYVEENVPEPATLVGTDEFEQFGHTQYKYTFKSDLRDMQFDISYVYSENEGWHYVNGYSAGLSEYYKEGVDAAYATSPAYDEKEYSFIITSEEDLRSIAKALAKANEVVADHWNYVPNAVIGRYDSVSMGVSLYRDNKNNHFWYYGLNGLDDEETIYNELEGEYNK